MSEALVEARGSGIETVAFGDLYLADIRAYRDRMMTENAMDAIYPVWGRETGRFVRDFVAAGFKAVIVCVDTAQLDVSFAGRLIDVDLLADLPAGIDPCGENGEFHTFVFDGPNFVQPIDITIGERVRRDGFCFCDLEKARG
jgi:uncharacterized protein (TIGR00290 family)